MLDAPLLVDGKDLTKLSVDYTGKIAKQVIKAQLTARLAEVREAYAEQKTTVAMQRETVHIRVMIAAIEEAKKRAAADKDITKLRRLLNKFSPEDAKREVLKNNESFIAAAYTSSLSMGTGDYKKSIKEILATGEVAVVVDLDVFEHSDYGDVTEPYGAVWPIDINEEQRDCLKTIVTEIEKADSQLESIGALERQLRNIDALVEELEATLLVNTLQQSTEGKAALDLTSQLVSRVLGETPALLQSS